MLETMMRKLDITDDDQDDDGEKTFDVIRAINNGFSTLSTEFIESSLNSRN